MTKEVENGFIILSMEKTGKFLCIWRKPARAMLRKLNICYMLGTFIVLLPAVFYKLFFCFAFNYLLKLISMNRNNYL